MRCTICLSCRALSARSIVLPDTPILNARTRKVAGFLSIYSVFIWVFMGTSLRGMVAHMRQKEGLATECVAFGCVRVSTGVCVSASGGARVLARWYEVSVGACGAPELGCSGTW